MGSSISTGKSFLICDISYLISCAISFMSSLGKSSATIKDRDSDEEDVIFLIPEIPEIL